MQLNEIVNLVSLIGTLAIIIGIWLGLKQLKLLRSQRRDLAIMECARSFEDREFTEAYRLLTRLKNNITKDELASMDKIYEEAALRVGMKFETIGLLIYKGVVPMDAMEDLVGGAAILIWNKLHQYIIDTRIKDEHPLFLEWFQWLVERLKEKGESDRIPAFIAHKDWKK